MPYAIPSDEERPILFRWLKQQSSYTAWATIEPYYTGWAEEFRRIAPLATDPKTGRPALTESDTRNMLICRAAFVDALAKLRRGDRSVFKWIGYGSGQGYFCEAWRVVGAWQTARGRIQEGLALADTAFWPEFERRLDALVSAWGWGKEVLQVRHTDLPAPLSDIGDLRGTYAVPRGAPPPNDKAMPDPVFNALKDRAQELPRVPEPPEEVLIRTGEEVPCYGIWEPVKADLSRGFIGMFKKPIVPANAKFELDGCMNYLHAGSPAPTIGFEGDGIRGEGRSTVWRLLWRDDRYLDGAIPEEENEYVFVAPAQAVATDGEPTNSVDNELAIRSSGTPAPHAGMWAAKDQLNVRVTVAQWALLPQHEGRDIEWVFVA